MQARRARVAPLIRDERIQAVAQAIDGGTCVVGVAGEMAMQACKNQSQQCVVRSGFR
jgi:hypothetical protein